MEPLLLCAPLYLVPSPSSSGELELSFSIIMPVEASLRLQKSFGYQRRAGYMLSDIRRHPPSFVYLSDERHSSTILKRLPDANRGAIDLILSWLLANGENEGISIFRQPCQEKSDSLRCVYVLLHGGVKGENSVL